MSTINFVPNDYVQQKQSNRANSLYLFLLLAVLCGIGATFSVLKMQQRSVRSEMLEISREMSAARDEIAKLEELKEMSNTRMKVMMMSASLLEPVPRSVLLASLTNNLPGSVSLLELNLDEKDPPKVIAPAQTKGAKAKSSQAKPAATETKIPEPEILLELKGLAPSDIEVASYIANLSGSILFDQVQLIQSNEKIIDGIHFREFRLKARIKPGVELTREDIESIRKKRNETI